MKHFKIHYLITTILFSLLFATGSSAKDSYEAVREAVKRLSPAIEDIAVSETPIPGLLQVVLDSEVVYFSADGKYLMQGSLYDLATRQDLTDNAKSGIRKKFIDQVDSSKLIVFAPEKPDYDVIVFTDIDCGYCRKLHNQMDEYNSAGIGIEYMAFPRAGIGSESYNKFVSAWCADDQQAALTFAKAGSTPEPKTCKNPIKDQYELGMKIGVTGTPAIFTKDGQMIPGYVPPKQLRERLDAMSASGK